MDYTKFKVIDYIEALKLMDNLTEIYDETIIDYMEALPDRQEFLNSLAKDGDVERFTIEVHSLKSMSWAVGAKRLGDKAYELEMLGHAGDLDNIREKMDELNEEMDLVMMDLYTLGR